jgi:hypothetical protein
MASSQVRGHHGSSSDPMEERRVFQLMKKGGRDVLPMMMEANHQLSDPANVSYCQGFTKSHSGMGLNVLQPQGLKE